MKTVKSFNWRINQICVYVLHVYAVRVGCGSWDLSDLCLLGTQFN